MIRAIRSGGVVHCGESGELHCEIWERVGRPQGKVEFGYMRHGGFFVRPATPWQEYRTHVVTGARRDAGEL
jgi:hypothetical protein